MADEVNQKKGEGNRPELDSMVPGLLEKDPPPGPDRGPMIEQTFASANLSLIA